MKVDSVTVFSTCWFDSGYKVASVHCVLSHFGAMLGSTVDTSLRQSTELFRVTTQRLVRQWIQIAFVYGILSYFTQCLVRQVDTYPQVLSLRQFQLLASPAGMAHTGGHVHRDMATTISCICLALSTEISTMHTGPHHHHHTAMASPLVVGAGAQWPVKF